MQDIQDYMVVDPVYFVNPKHRAVEAAYYQAQAEAAAELGPKPEPWWQTVLAGVCLAVFLITLFICC